MIDKGAFLARFPRLFLIRAIDAFEAAERGLRSDTSFWLFMAPFEFVSSVWGPIVIPEGATTDFASVPKFLRGVYDDDSQILLYPSAPHDLLFQEKPDGSRGWLPDGRQLSLHECNLVLVEAMEACGASALDRANIFAAVEIANQPIRHTFRS